MKLFGSDGIKGIFGKDVTPELAFRVGRAAVRRYGKGNFVIAQDPRVSGGVLVEALVKGINTEKGVAFSLGILPVPALAYFTKQYCARCGIMVSASRHAPEFNGIKIFNADGLKLEEEEEERFEELMNAMVDREGVPAPTYVARQAYSEYVDYLKSFCGKSLRGITVRLDCAYGACAGLAPEVFRGLGARVYAYNDAHMGAKINVGCGLRHPEFLLARMESEQEIGFAFDGDGDSLRVLLGRRVLDGDSVLYLLSRSLPLEHGVVVGTSLNNLALERALADDGLRLVRTGVGNKHVTREIFHNGYTLGGEQNGHYCIRGAVVTSDALLAAVVLLDYLCRDGRLAPAPALVLYPQRTQTYAAGRSVLKHPALRALIAEAEADLGAEGRVVARMSGTGSRVRIMVESKSAAAVDVWQSRFAALLAELGEVCA